MNDMILYFHYLCTFMYFKAIRFCYRTYYKIRILWCDVRTIYYTIKIWSFHPRIWFVKKTSFFLGDVIRSMVAFALLFILVLLCRSI